MPSEQESTTDELNEGERIAALVQARAGLAAALNLLDRHSRSPAAANVDLAIHLIDQELGD